MSPRADESRSPHPAAQTIMWHEEWVFAGAAVRAQGRLVEDVPLRCAAPARLHRGCAQRLRRDAPSAWVWRRSSAPQRRAARLRGTRCGTSSPLQMLRKPQQPRPQATRRHRHRRRRCCCFWRKWAWRLLRRRGAGETRACRRSKYEARWTHGRAGSLHGCYTMLTVTMHPSQMKKLRRGGVMPARCAFADPPHRRTFLVRLQCAPGTQLHACRVTRTTTSAVRSSSTVFAPGI